MQITEETALAESGNVMDPYQSPAELDETPSQPWWMVGDRLALLIAVGVVATVFVAFVDWTSIIR